MAILLVYYLLIVYGKIVASVVVYDPLSNLNQYTWREWRATFEPLNMKDNETVLFYALLDICFLLCNETTSKFILNQLDYSPSFSTSDS